MQWKAFKDELPEEDRPIVYGNHRQLDYITYHYTRIKTDLSFRPPTHWSYIELPPYVNGTDLDRELKWKTI